MEENKEKKSKNGFIGGIAIALVLGLIIGAGVVYFLTGGKTIAKAKGTTISSNDLYKKMKSYYSVSLVLEDIDKGILDKKYDLSEEELADVKETADHYIEQYESYGYTQEKFLEENGFESYDDFVEYLSLDYKRTLNYYDYIETLLDENAVQTYYDENAFGEVNTKHILVQTSDTVTDEQALAIANEIIGRLNAGEEFDALADEYKEKYADNVTVEDLGKMGAFSNLESAYVEAMKSLEAGKYTETPVQTSYGYHVIYCVDRTEKSSTISRKDRMAIVDTLSADLEEVSNNSNLYYETLINLRKDAKLKFYDKELKEKYEEYCKQYLVEETDDTANN